jgi:TRAP-type transport system periplasmic protein
MGQQTMAKRSISARVIAAVRGFALAALFAAPLAMADAGGAAAQDNKAMVLKLATATLNDAQHEWLKRFAAKIEKATNGRMKAEVYPASQLGAIPRMIEGTQLGSIQMWVGPPEFLVGVDQRFELLSAPGLIQNDQHAVRLLNDAEFTKSFLTLGANKGLVGASLFLTGPGAIDMRTPARRLADLKGKKIRVLASPFQMEQMTRLDATGVPLTLGDVLPAIQQGTIDGAFGSTPVFTALQYQGAAKYMLETGQAYIFSLAAMSKRWFDPLPADLKQAVLATAQEATKEVIPWGADFITAQRKVWADKGGEVIYLPEADHAEMIAKLRPVGDEIVKSKPALKPMWDELVAAAKRAQ